MSDTTNHSKKNSNGNTGKKTSLKERLGAHGDLPARYLRWGVLHCPAFLEPLFVIFYSLLTLAIFHKGRRSAIANFLIIKPQDSPPRRLLRAWSLWRSYAWTKIDTIHATADGDIIDWEIQGKSLAQQLDTQTSGVIIMTAHMGNYDLAATVFAKRLGSPLVAVRAPEPKQPTREFHQKQREATPNAAVHHAYNQPDSLLGIQLLKNLAAGHNIALQGDRVMLHVACETIPWNHAWDWKLPSGPFLLAYLSKAPIWPLFVWREGYRRYRLTFHPPIICPPGRADKHLIMKNLRHQWAAALRPVVEAHPEQWMVFENVFQPRSNNLPIHDTTPPTTLAPEPLFPIPATKKPRPRLIGTLTVLAALWLALLSWAMLPQTRPTLRLLTLPWLTLILLHASTLSTSLLSGIISRLLPTKPAQLRPITTGLWILGMSLLTWHLTL